MLTRTTWLLNLVGNCNDVGGSQGRGGISFLGQSASLHLALKKL